MSRSKIAVLIAALIAVAATLVTIGLIAGGTKSDEPSDERVRLEIRALPVARIVIDGKGYGTTPLSIYVPQRSQPLTVDALMETHLMTGRGRSLEQQHKMTKHVVPD